MENIRSNWLTEQMRRSSLLPMVRLALPMADRLWSFVALDTNALVGGYFDADVDYDAEVYFDPGGVYYERSARLLSIDGIEQGVRTFDSAVLGSWGQSERPSIHLTVDNGDGEMSRMIGQEYVLNQSMTTYLTFPSLSASDALSKSVGAVQRWLLTSKQLQLECSPK